MHEVLVNRLGSLSLPRKSVARLTDRPDMTLDVYRARKTTVLFTVHVKQQYNKSKPKFAEETGFGENFILRLKEDAVPSIFVDAEGREKRPAER